jgi:hypothetical protein
MGAIKVKTTVFELATRKLVSADLIAEITQFVGIADVTEFPDKVHPLPTALYVTAPVPLPPEIEMPIAWPVLTVTFGLLRINGAWLPSGGLTNVKTTVLEVVIR